MARIYSWAETPLSAIQEIYDEDGKDFVERVRAYFTRKLETTGSFSVVPSLNDVPLHLLKTNTLVRFRCMIQDMFDPEFYLGQYTVRNVKTGTNSTRLGMFQDLAQCEPQEEAVLDSADNKTMDRQTFYCVPIPGENQWVKECFSKESQSHEIPCSTSSDRVKRTLDDTEVDMATETASNVLTNGVAVDKLCSSIKTTEMSSKGDRNDTKKLKTDLDSTGKALETPDLNFPLPEETGSACLVKVYESKNDFKVNDMVEFIGILSNHPAMVDFPEDTKGEQPSFLHATDQEMDVAEQQVHAPPPSLVPRLHVVTSRNLTHSNPLLPHPINENTVKQKEMQVILCEATETRAALLELLRDLLFGDSLAAEYLLCHLVSTVYTRQDIVALGKFGLNLSGCPRNSTFVSRFYEIVNPLLVKSYLLPLTVDGLNTTKFTPRKDYALNRLTSGVLQLSDNTHFIVDETTMQPGQLDTRGVTNLTAIGNVISWQKVEYDFNFHKQEFRTNINVLVMSEGKSFIKCDCQCPLAVDSVSEEQLEKKLASLQAHLTPEVLLRLRRYLGLIQRLPYNALPDDLQKEIENDFVECRKNNKQNMTVDDLHMLLTLARLVSLTHGEMKLSRELWEKAKQMEYARKQRFTTTAQTA